MKRPSPLLFIYTGGDYTTCGAADQIGVVVITTARFSATPSGSLTTEKNPSVGTIGSHFLADFRKTLAYNLMNTNRNVIWSQLFTEFKSKNRHQNNNL
ncbi:hypothetical protein [Aeromonas dhakensis]|uniref:hypothetical protein n=1 Tax=Aeromonas dhakensis TaxID=196024 RepID=UPI001CEFD6CB|nr:hypothetical protein [Aeromonas dhakensis]UCM45050.1 hypothetical protein LEO73_21395 [Aeromonas dhakensis]WAF72843.1 hypothetical protein NRK99_00710 [Aeromonas dhakensis]